MFVSRDSMTARSTGKKQFIQEWGYDLAPLCVSSVDVVHYESSYPLSRISFVSYTYGYMSKVKIGVIRGGWGNQYNVSIKTGGSVLAALPCDEYDVLDIFITSDGAWHMNGVPTTPEKVSRSVDLVWNALHGEFGEDGKVQKILDVFGVPYTGSTAISSAVGMNKVLAKRTFDQFGIKSPRGVVVVRGEEIEDVIARVRYLLRAPYVIKPVQGGSSIGLSFVRTDAELILALERALACGMQALVEEYVLGREMTISVIDAMDGAGLYIIQPLEVLLPEGVLFSYDAKYGETHPVGIARLTSADRSLLEDVVFAAHRGLGIRHYARYDVIMGEGCPYLLEVNTLPCLAKESLFQKSLMAQGLSFSGFTDYIATLALQEK
jgi:D-alanine-D-alanine ligase